MKALLWYYRQIDLIVASLVRIRENGLLYVIGFLLAVQ